MFNIKNYEYDCTRKCRCVQHGNTITAALTKRSIADDKLAAFIAKTCCNFGDVVDDLGRSAVHLAASVNRYTILEWLLNLGASINGRDFECGGTPLHRAIYYGCIDCAVLLLRYGANSELLDEDKRCPLQNVCLKWDYPNGNEEIKLENDIFVWGSNMNYNLGICNEEVANIPQYIELFRKQQISITDVALGAYHSLFLDKKQQLYAVGHGKGGRLGTANETSLPTPKKVKVPLKNVGEFVRCISVSRKHSLLLTNHSAVYTCGLNDDQQLGIRGAGAKLTVFKEVQTLRDLSVGDLMSVIARDYHSLAYAGDGVYFWGTNYGQMGMNENTASVPLPTKCNLKTMANIKFVEANNFATAVCTEDNNILLLYKFKTKSLKAPNFETIKSVALVGGDNVKLVGKGSITALKLLILTQTDAVFLWYEMTQNFYRCIFSHLRITQIDKIIYKANQVLILSHGDVYSGKCKQISVPADDNIKCPKKRSSKETSNSIWSRCDHRIAISREHTICISLERLATSDRVVNIYCDDDFASFAVLQESNFKYFQYPQLMPKEYTFKKLLNEVNENDAIHDVVFNINGEMYAAHRVIIYARAVGLRTLIADYIDDGSKYIKLDFSLLTGKMFEIMLKFIYTNYFPNGDDFDAIQQSLGPESPVDHLGTCKLFLHFVEKFQLNDLICFLKSFLQQNAVNISDIDKSKFRFNRLRRTIFPALYDIRIICADKVELWAHKCILVARSDYFDMMFAHSWSEQNSIKLTNVPSEYMEPILDFLYTEQLPKRQYSEEFLYNMIVFCDQFLIERLRTECEILLLPKITIRKCGAMLDFAHTYNCEELKRGSLDFICQNMGRVLLHRSLEGCEPAALKCINTHYRQMFKCVFDYRMITPDSEAIDDDLLLSFVEDFAVDLDYRVGVEDKTSLHPMTPSAKQTFSRTNLSTRQHERDAISSMIKSLQLGEASEMSSESHNLPNKMAQDKTLVADAKLQPTEAESWMKVVDKKDPKKKTSQSKLVPKANDNDTSRLKDKTKLELESSPFFTAKNCNKDIRQSIGKNNLTSSSSARGHKEQEEEDVISITLRKSSYNLNLTDFKTPLERMSQKQRKQRLSADKLRSPTSLLSEPPKGVAAVAIALPPTNAWKTMTSTATIATPASDPNDGASIDVTAVTSYPNLSHVADKEVKYSNKRVKETQHSLTKIIAEEKQQREEYERMRNKSLALTQIEEAAIAELKQFYNADNADDEVITVERKSTPRTMNFAVWQRKSN